ncbi:MAG: FKBP-type peptidyl-prolyl cis-trans isomerase [Flavobacteriales bacterium]
MFFKFLLLLSTTVMLSSCGNDFSKTDSGLYFKIIRENPNERKGTLDSDVMMLNLSYYSESDSLIFSSADRPEGFVYIPLIPPSYKGDIMEGLAMLHVGDSALFKVVADSFFIKNAGIELIPGIKKGSLLTFYVGVRDIKSRQQLMDEQMGQRKRDYEEIEKLRELEPTERQQYLERNGITAKPSESGLIYIEELKGKGPKAQKDKRVYVHYAGYLLNGRKFDSSFDRGEPIDFILGAGQVIAGWEEGISMMNVGTKAKLIIPSILGYGSNGSPPTIPPYSTLVFDVELVKIE